MKGRNIMSGVMALHENSPWDKKKEKNWGDPETRLWKGIWQGELGVSVFLLNTQRFRWSVVWMDQTGCDRGTVSVKLNNQIGNYFQSAKGVGRGIPSPPSFLTMWSIA
jgi:hypothetical protein